MTPEERCKRHWKNNLGINNTEDLRLHIETIFKRNSHQQDVLIRLHQMLFPDWEQLKTVGGYPEIGKDLWDYLAIKFAEFDHKHHPDALVNFWERDGFKLNENLSPWGISFQSCHLQYYTPRERKKKRQKKLKAKYKRIMRKKLKWGNRTRNNYRKGDLIC